MKAHRQADYAQARAVCSTRNEMAAMLGVTPETVSAQLSNFKLLRFPVFRVHQQALKQQIVDRFTAGESVSKIATALGFTRGKVAGILSREGAYGKGQRPQPKREKKPRRPKHQPKEFAPPKFKKIDFKKREADVSPLHVSFDELEHDMCRYPYGDGPFSFCGNPRQEGFSYCPGHCALVYRPAEARIRDARPR